MKISGYEISGYKNIVNLFLKINFHSGTNFVITVNVNCIICGLVQLVSKAP